jgi:hypothetical protein
MSRSLFTLSLAALMTLSLIATAGADDSASTDGLQAGDPIGVFYVTKVAGAVDDEVEPGETLCYRCRYGSRPMVMVFARDTGGRVPELLKAIEQSVGENEEARLKGIMTLIGEDAATLKNDAGKIAEKVDAKLVPVVVAKETKTGPLSYKISETADVTIVLANDSQVVNAQTFDAAKIDVSSIIGQVKEMLN